MMREKLKNLYKGLFVMNTIATILHYINDTGYFLVGIGLMVFCAIMVYVLRRD